MTSSGIQCVTHDGRRVLLDPRRPEHDAVNFVSHAHTDHLPSRKYDGKLLASVETDMMACLRGFHMDDRVDSIDGFQMINSGHILGSKGLLFDDIFYTGDICTRSRGFLQGAKTTKCKVLITECTFGSPEFVFPDLKQIKKQVNELISGLYGKGIPVILMGYQLGKAQTLTNLFGHWCPMYLYDSVKEMNELHGKLGVHLEDGIGHTEAEEKGLLDKKPWVMVAPMLSAKSEFLTRMKSRYGAVTIGFSGWAQSPKSPLGRRADYSIPLSDHCGYDDLVDMVQRSEAEQVYTIHGYVDEFATHLRDMGIKAQPLVK